MTHQSASTPPTSPTTTRMTTRTGAVDGAVDGEPGSAPSASSTEPLGVRGGSSAPGWRRRLVQRHAAFRARIRRRQRVYLAYRIFIGVVGTLITVLGLAAIVLPGPGWALVFLGLGVLATEFSWAQRLLRWTRNKVVSWTRWVQRQPLWLRAGVALVLLVLAALAVWWYLTTYGAPAFAPFVETGWGKR